MIYKKNLVISIILTIIIIIGIVLSVVFLNIHSKIKLDLKFENETVTYDGKAHSLYVKGAPDDFVITYTNNDKTDPGTYEIEAFINGDDKKYEYPNKMKATLTILKADFNLDGLVFEDKTVTYDGNSHILGYKFENKPEGLSLSLTGERHVNAGVYEYTLNFTVDEYHNEIAPIKRYLTIAKADYDMSAVIVNPISVYYDMDYHDVVVENLPQGLRYELINAHQIEIGHYDVIVKFYDTTGNYNNPADMHTTIDIISYTEGDVIFTSNTYDYDGSIKYLEAEHIPYGYKVEYENNFKKDAGIYTVTAILFEGNEEKKRLTATLTINKRDFVFDNNLFVSKKVTYSGDEYSIYYSGFIPSDIEIIYEGNGKTNVGSYVVTMKLGSYDNRNYNIIDNLGNQFTFFERILTIEKIKYNMSHVTFSDKSVPFTLNGTNVTILGTLPENVTVRYLNALYADDLSNPGNFVRDIGEYYIIAKFITPDNENYEQIEDITAKITVTKGSLAGYSFNAVDEEIEYDGNPHTFDYTNYVVLPQELSIEYISERTLTDVGEIIVKYRITPNPQDIANFDEATFINLESKFKIKPKKLEVSDIYLNDAMYTYDGNSHSLAYSGDLLSIIQVEYENNDKKDVGIYNVIMRLSIGSNYELIGKKEYSSMLTIVESPIEGIAFKGESYVYDGIAHSITITKTLGFDDLYTVEYENNDKVDSGTYDVNAIIKSKSTGNTITILTAKLNILKKKIDNDLVFSGSTFIYDGLEHELHTIGRVPDGITVEFTNNKATLPGKYEAVCHLAVINSNYYVENEYMYADLVIEALKVDKGDIIFKSRVIPYDGSIKAITIENTLPYGVNVNYIYKLNGNIVENALDVGEYEVIARFTVDSVYYSLIDDVVATLSITRNTIKGYLTNNIFDFDYNTKDVRFVFKDLDGNIITNNEDFSVEYINEKLIYAGNYTVVGKITNLTNNYIIDEYITEDVEIKAISFHFDLENITQNFDGKIHNLDTSILDEKGIEYVLVNGRERMKGTYTGFIVYNTYFGSVLIDGNTSAILTIL